MLRILRITLKNFGPFKGVQTISLPADDGVVIVYGENGRGKTTLLNALRYGLFGKVLGRGSRAVSVHKVGNWESFEAGDFGFEVELQMQHEDGLYKLTRTCKPRQGVLVPNSDEDYTQQVYLSLDDVILGPDETKAHLSRIMPEQVSRFFLFDGELLQEYEELLWEESEAAQRIKASIEKILGVPLLTSARAHLSELWKDAQTAESKQARKKKETELIGNKLAETFTQRQVLEGELKEAEDRQASLKKKKSALEEERKRNERVAKLLKEREDLEQQCERIATKTKEKGESFKEHARDAWQTVLRPKVATLREDLQKTMDDFDNKKFERHLALHRAEQITKAAESGNCPMCASGITPDSMKRLKENAGKQVPNVSEDDEREIRRVRPLLDALQKFHAIDKRDVLHALVGDIGDLRAENASAKDRIREIDDAIGGANEADVRKIERDFEAMVKELTIIEAAVVKLRLHLDEIKVAIVKLEEKLDEIGGAEIQVERNRRETYSALVELFSEGVAAYRDRLREKVSEASTELFKLFSGDTDYDALNINSNYGLSIRHRDGGEISIRSAGYEHLIALSLMGALQRCSPLRGPIIMDSPAGRLDGTHKKKVTEALPKLSPQVFLLVFKDEMSPAKAREYLRGSLVGEYQLVRKSARHTAIERLVGG